MLQQLYNKLTPNFTGLDRLEQHFNQRYTIN